MPKDLPPAHGDERRLTQVLLNLVGNAIKFTDTGEVAIRASVADGRFTVAVRDTGPGIAEPIRRKIFEEFQQADISTTKKKGGTGLGLAIAKRIIEMHGGRIWVESKLGAGLDLLVHGSGQGRAAGEDTHEQTHPRGRGPGDNRQILRDLLATPAIELIEARERRGGGGRGRASSVRT